MTVLNLLALALAAPVVAILTLQTRESSAIQEKAVAQQCNRR